MTVNIGQTTAAVFIAFVAWVVVQVNLANRRRRATMTPAEREAEDEENARISQEW